MSNIITVRDSEIIAAEINTIKADVRRAMIWGSIQIGEKLTEAKSTVPFGEWGRWLEEKVNYSQSTANNLMQLYREYGQQQGNLFDDWTNSETFGKLSYSQHMALLALPFADRAEFAESVGAEEMSTRELEKAVREELAKAEQDRDKAIQERDRLATQAEDAKKTAEAQKAGAQLARDEAARLTAELEKAQKQGERSAKEAEKLHKQLEDAKKTEQNIRSQMEDMRENPKIPAAVMQRLQMEAEQEAARKATADLRKQLTEAEEGKRKAELAAKELEEKLAANEKNAKLADPEIAKFLTLCEQLQEDHNRIKGLYTKTKLTDETKAGSMMKAATALLEELRRSWG